MAKSHAELQELVKQVESAAKELNMRNPQQSRLKQRPTAMKMFRSTWGWQWIGAGDYCFPYVRASYSIKMLLEAQTMWKADWLWDQPSRSTWQNTEKQTDPYHDQALPEERSRVTCKKRERERHIEAFKNKCTRKLLLRILWTTKTENIEVSRMANTNCENH